MISLSFSGESDQHVIDFLTQTEPRVLAAIEPALMRAMVDLQVYIQRNKLQGQVLKSHKNGAGLAGSLNVRVDKEGAILSGYVGTALVYARIHEYGFFGQEFVPNHYRMQTQAWGRSITPREVYVRNHYREMAMPARPYMAPSLAEKREAIMKRLLDAILKAIDTA